MRKLPFYFIVFSSIFFLASCVTQPRYVSRTVVISNPPVVGAPVYYYGGYYGCSSGCCSNSCGYPYWTCSNLNLDTSQCGYWQYRYPYYRQDVVVY